MDTSYLTSQVGTIIGQLHGLFDEIGVPNHERESREAEVSVRGYFDVPYLIIHSFSMHSPRPSTTMYATSLQRRTI